MIGEVSMLHITSAIRGGWNVIKRDAKRALKHFANRGAAIAFAKKLCNQMKTDLYIHDHNGFVEKVLRYSSNGTSKNILRETCLRCGHNKIVNSPCRKCEMEKRSYWEGDGVCR